MSYVRIVNQLCEPQWFGAISPALCAKNLAIGYARAIKNVVTNARPVAAIVGDVKVTIGIFAEHGSAQLKTQR